MISVNVVTTYADEWFDSIEEADKYIHYMEDDEEVVRYDLYENGVLQLFVTDGITYKMGE